MSLATTEPLACHNACNGSEQLATANPHGPLSEHHQDIKSRLTTASDPDSRTPSERNNMLNLNATLSSRAALLAALVVSSCSPATSTDVSAAGGDSAGDTSTGGASGGANAAGGKANTVGAAGDATNNGTAGDESSTAGKGGAAAADALTGTFFLFQDEAGSSYGFDVAWTPGSGLACKTTTSGPCSARVCELPAEDAGTRMIKWLDAGAIHVTGAGASMATATYGPLAPTAPGHVGYANVVGSTGPFFKAGDTLTLTGDGGADVPAFTAQTVIAPSDVVLTEPACTANTCPDLDRSQDLAVAWTGGVAGTVSVTVERDGADSQKTVTCEFDAKAGSGTMPHGLLGLLEPPVSGDASGSLSLITRSVRQFTLGGLPNILRSLHPQFGRRRSDRFEVSFGPYAPKAQMRRIEGGKRT